MIDEIFFIGKPYEFSENFFIYPPTVEQVLTCKDFGEYSTILLITQEEIEDNAVEKNIDFKKLPTPFEFLLMSCYSDKKIETAIKKAFQFFCYTPITFMYEEKKILIGDLEKILLNTNNLDSLTSLSYLTEENYFKFQNILRQAIGQNPVAPYEVITNPKLKRMKALARYRDKVKAKTASKQSLKTMLASICCMGIGITPLNIGQMSYAAIHPLITTYQNKERYDIDVRSLIAGADSKKVHPTYWMEDVNE